MLPPLCCIGSRQIEALALYRAFFAVSKALGFEREDRPRERGGIPAGLWDLGGEGAWIYVELLWFRHNASAIAEVFAARLSHGAEIPLELYFLELAHEQLAYRRYRFYPDGRRQSLRHPAADALLDRTSLRPGDDLTAAAEAFFRACVGAGSLALTPQAWLAHQGSPRQLGLLTLISLSVGHRVEIHRAFGGLELHLLGEEGERVVHFLAPEELEYLCQCSPRFARLPVEEK